MKIYFPHNLVRVYTEHAYVQYPCFKMECPTEIHTKIMRFLRMHEVEIYGNHFVLEFVENGKTLYIGYNDNYLYIGSEFNKLTDSKTIEVNTP